VNKREHIASPVHPRFLIPVVLVPSCLPGPVLNSSCLEGEMNCLSRRKHPAAVSVYLVLHECGSVPLHDGSS